MVMGSELHDFDIDPSQEGPQPGPSWVNKRWPITDAAAGDDLTQAMDPMAMQVAIKEAAKKAGAPLDETALQQAAGPRAHVERTTLEEWAARLSAAGQSCPRRPTNSTARAKAWSESSHRPSRKAVRALARRTRVSW